MFGSSAWSWLKVGLWLSKSQIDLEAVWGGEGLGVDKCPALFTRKERPVVLEQSVAGTTHPQPRCTTDLLYKC